MNEEQVLEIIAEVGCIQDTGEATDAIRDLWREGTILRCDEIPHNRLMLNPSYVYVVNDERGKKLAILPLFTSLDGRFATRNSNVDAWAENRIRGGVINAKIFC